MKRPMNRLTFRSNHSRQLYGFNSLYVIPLGFMLEPLFVVHFVLALGRRRLRSCPVSRIC